MPAVASWKGELVRVVGGVAPTLPKAGFPMVLVVGAAGVVAAVALALRGGRR